jgi:hypothetical protein
VREGFHGAGIVQRLQAASRCIVGTRALAGQGTLIRQFLTASIDQVFGAAMWMVAADGAATPSRNEMLKSTLPSMTTRGTAPVAGQFVLDQRHRGCLPNLVPPLTREGR